MYNSPPPGGLVRLVVDLLVLREVPSYNSYHSYDSYYSYNSYNIYNSYNSYNSDPLL